MPKTKVQEIVDQFKQRYDELAPDFDEEHTWSDELVTTVIHELLEMGVIVPGPRKVSTRG